MLQQDLHIQLLFGDCLQHSVFHKGTGPARTDRRIKAAGILDPLYKVRHRRPEHRTGLSLVAQRLHGIDLACLGKIQQPVKKFRAAIDRRAENVFSDHAAGSLVHHVDRFLPHVLDPLLAVHF